jgi:hypothetical protein
VRRVAAYDEAVKTHDRQREPHQPHRSDERDEDVDNGDGAHAAGSTTWPATKIGGPSARPDSPSAPFLWGNRRRRRSVQREILPRKRRLAALLKELAMLPSEQNWRANLALSRFFNVSQPSRQDFASRKADPRLSRPALPRNSRAVRRMLRGPGLSEPWDRRAQGMTMANVIELRCGSAIFFVSVLIAGLGSA